MTWRLINKDRISILVGKLRIISYNKQNESVNIYEYTSIVISLPLKAKLSAIAEEIGL